MIYIPVEEIVEKYKNKASLKGVAKIYGMSETTVRSKIKQYEEKTGLKILIDRKKVKEELPEEEIVKQYKKGNTLKEVAQIYGTSSSTVRKIILEYQEKTKQQILRNINDAQELPVEEIVEQYKNGASLRYIAKIYGTSRTTIREKILGYEKETRQKVLRDKNEVLKKELPEEEIVKKYKQGVSLKKIAKIYGISDGTVLKRIKKYEEETREKILGKKGETLKKALPVEEIVKQYKEGASSKKIAKIYGISDSTVWRRIKKHEEETSQKIIRNKSEAYKNAVPKKRTGKVEQKNEEKINLTQEQESKVSEIVKEYLKKGMKTEEIKQTAIKMGISEEIIEEAIKNFNNTKKDGPDFKDEDDALEL